MANSDSSQLRSQHQSIEHRRHMQNKMYAYIYTHENKQQLPIKGQLIVSQKRINRD